MIDEIKYFCDKVAAAPPLQWSRFVPFKVTFKMGAPVCVTTPWISFDGLLSHLLLLDALGEDYFVTPKKLDLSSHLPRNRRMLPLLRTGEIYHASVSQFHPNMLRVDTIYKRFEERWTDNLKQRKIRMGSGHFRAYMMKQPYITAKEVVFYACGDIKLVRELIDRYICGIGNDYRIGYGAVRGILIEPTPEDYSIVANDVAMRPVPIEMCEKYEDAVYLPYKPPYWSPRNVVLCVPPGARCKLKDEYERSLAKVGRN